MPGGTTPALSAQLLNYSDPSLFCPFVNPIILWILPLCCDRHDVHLPALCFTRIEKSQPSESQCWKKILGQHTRFRSSSKLLAVPVKGHHSCVRLDREFVWASHSAHSYRRTVPATNLRLQVLWPKERIPSHYCPVFGHIYPNKIPLPPSLLKHHHFTITKQTRSSSSPSKLFLQYSGLPPYHCNEECCPPSTYSTSTFCCL